MESTDQSFGFLLLLLQLLAIVIRHGDNGENEIDEVEGSHEDDDDEEDHVVSTVRCQDLQKHISLSTINASSLWLIIKRLL